MLSFKGRHFPKDLILMAVRWKHAYPLSYRHIEELMEERGAALDHSTVQKWVVYYAPQLEQTFRKRKKAVGKSWKVDETYIKVNGKWVYLCGIKNITKYTLGFKSFQAAEATIAGIELHHMLKKGQMQNSRDVPAWKQFYELAA